MRGELVSTEACVASVSRPSPGVCVLAGGGEVSILLVVCVFSSDEGESDVSAGCKVSLWAGPDWTSRMSVFGVR